MATLTPRRLAQAGLTQSLLYLARMYRRLIDRRLAEHNISDARALPVLHIHRAGDGMRQRELAEALGIEGPSLVRLLDQLCAAGLVERHADPADGRAKTLHMTDDGRAMADVVETVLHDLRDQLMIEISDEDLAATLRTMQALESALKNHPRQAGD